VRKKCNIKRIKKHGFSDEVRITNPVRQGVEFPNKKTRKEVIEMMGGGMFFGWFFWIALIVGGIWLVKAFTDQNRNQRQSGTDKAPINILKERYASGELDRKEFEELKNDLLKA